MCPIGQSACRSVNGYLDWLVGQSVLSHTLSVGRLVGVAVGRSVGLTVGAAVSQSVGLSLGRLVIINLFWLGELLRSEILNRESCDG